jgi:hypothetical protein
LARFPLLLCALMAAGAASQIAAPGAARSIIFTETGLLAAPLAYFDQPRRGHILSPRAVFRIPLAPCRFTQKNK